MTPTATGSWKKCLTINDEAETRVFSIFQNYLKPAEQYLEQTTGAEMVWSVLQGAWSREVLGNLPPPTMAPPREKNSFGVEGTEGKFSLKK